MAAVVARLQAKAAKCMETKEFYEAHQVYRTLYSRMLTSGKHEELLEILYNGSLALIEAHQTQSGFDLADLFADVLLKSSTPSSVTLLRKIEKLFTALCCVSNNEESETTARPLKKFVADITKWSQTIASKPREKSRGLGELHLIFAKVFWKNELYSEARSHFLVAECPEAFAEFLIDVQTKEGNKDEHDLFITLSILQLCCLRRVKTAKRLLVCYMERHPITYGKIPTAFPLINFCSILVDIILPRRKRNEFAEVCSKYTTALSRDPTYPSLLEKIGQMYFNISPPQQGNNPMGIFGNLFKGLLGKQNEEEAEEFNTSDIEFEQDDGEEEDGYETADEETTAQPTPVTTTSKPSSSKTVDTMDDLD